MKDLSKSTIDGNLLAYQLVPDSETNDNSDDFFGNYSDFLTDDYNYNDSYNYFTLDIGGNDVSYDVQNYSYEFIFGKDYVDYFTDDTEDYINDYLWDEFGIRSKPTVFLYANDSWEQLLFSYNETEVRWKISFSFFLDYKYFSSSFNL